MSTILVVDDDPAIREMLLPALRSAGFETQEAGSTAEARRVIESGPPDLILLDWMLPGQSGFEFARSLFMDTSRPAIPVIMLTARGQVEDKVAALEAGADDYVSKPFSISELLARIQAVLRRSGPDTGGEVHEFGELQFDPASHRVSVSGIALELAPMEYQLLLFFLKNRERVYSRKELIKLVWGSGTYVEARTVDVHIRRLRMALEPSGYDRLIQTVRGAGYRFSAQE
ncbi:MAG TPA: response regulator [Gammaproteobacteria bacterium]|nr:response regulator [Gammaproteobacteria bacterium]